MSISGLIDKKVRLEVVLSVRVDIHVVVCFGALRCVVCYDEP